ncbi:MAG: DNRLRE domain-containing protein [Candidatus Bathyarchaeia archaeon]
MSLTTLYIEMSDMRNYMKKTALLMILSLLALSVFAATTIIKVEGQTVVETYVLEASEDTYVDERGAYRNSNFGDEAFLTVGSSPEGNQRAYIKFDLSELPYGSVRSAKLVINATKVPLAERTYEAYVVSGAWDAPSWTESNLTWDNQPGWWDLLDTATLGGIDATVGPVEFDVKEAVKMWINRWWPNHGFLIRDWNEWSPARFYASFDSSESAMVTGRPKLIIELILSPTFELSVYPTRMSSPTGGSTQWWIHLRSVNGWYGTINLEAKGLETFEGSATFEKTSVTLSPYGDVGLTLTVTAGFVRKGSYTFTINGTSGIEFAYDTGVLDIVPAPLIRDLPDAFTPNMPYSVGTPITIQLTYIPGSIDGLENGNPTAMILKERLPWYLKFLEGSSTLTPDIVRLDDKGDADPYNDETTITWLFAHDFEAINLTLQFAWTYRVNFTIPDDTPPERVPHDIYLWGDWQAMDNNGMSMFGGVLGDNYIKMEFGLPGPWDDDGRVDDFEILQAIIYWKRGQMDDAQLLQYIQLWISSSTTPPPPPQP